MTTPHPQPTEALTYVHLFSYFRLGLATGIVGKKSIIAWADREILASPNPAHEVIELSLSGELPYSQLLRLLSSFLVQTEYQVSLSLLFARAGMLLEEGSLPAPQLTQELLLLMAEERLPAETRAELWRLDAALDEYNLGLDRQLAARLARFLAGYAHWRQALRQIHPETGGSGSSLALDER